MFGIMPGDLPTSRDRNSLVDPNPGRSDLDRILELLKPHPIDMIGGMIGGSRNRNKIPTAITTSLLKLLYDYNKPQIMY